ncbi:MAG: SDR family oxidoreductase [Dehalococcoidales bacterium]|jgi:NAD(P)-dependent dehydrogenase (short-subunit alcohol dehydrogenase family)
MSSLKGKVAMVTGAASKRGMGHAIALKLASEGADVIIADKFAAPQSKFPGDENWGGLDEVVKEIKTLGKKGLALTVDINVSKDIDTAMEKVLKQFGKLDILVHAAAIRGPVGVNVVDLAEKDIRAVIDVDLVGSFLVCKAAAKAMVAGGKGGRIVIFCSQAGTHGVPGSAAYAAAKYGTIGLTKSLALELAKYQINVNGINPGMIVTNLRDEAFQKMAEADGITWEEARKKDQGALATRIPWGRLGTPEEAADLAYFLVSDLSAYITGEVIALSGGAT